MHYSFSGRGEHSLQVNPAILSTPPRLSIMPDPGSHYRYTGKLPNAGNRSESPTHNAPSLSDIAFLLPRMHYIQFITLLLPRLHLQVIAFLLPLLPLCWGLNGTHLG